MIQPLVFTCESAKSVTSKELVFRKERGKCKRPEQHHGFLVEQEIVAQGNLTRALYSRFTGLYLNRQREALG
jgi:hypothetical protein